MQHSKLHSVLIHGAASVAMLFFLCFFMATGTFHAHAQPSSSLNGTNSGSQASPLGQNAGSQSAIPSGQTIANPLKYDTLDALLSAVLKAAIQIGSIVLTLALVWVGFKFVAARGNEEKIRSARTALMWTVIGGLILLGATAIQSVITSTVGSITS